MTTSTPSTPIATLFSAPIHRSESSVGRTRLHCYPGIVHMAPDVREDLGLETELADGLTVEPRLLRGGRRGELDVVDAELVQRLGNLDLGLGVEEGVGELLALTKGGLDWREEEASVSRRAGVRL